MRILIIKDKSVTNNTLVESSLNSLKKEYEGITDVVYLIEEQDLSSIPWIKYDEQTQITQSSAVALICKDINNRLAGEYDWDIVMLFFAEENWEGGNTWGWSLATFFNNFQVCLIRTIPDDVLLSYVVRHEVNHCMDNFALRELGVDIGERLGLGKNSWDFQVVHGGLVPPYPISVGEKYRDYLLQVKDIIHEFFEIRKKKYELGILQIIYSLYLKVVYLWKQKDKQ